MSCNTVNAFISEKRRVGLAGGCKITREPGGMAWSQRVCPTVHRDRAESHREISNDKVNV